MADYVVTATMADGISDPAIAAAAAMDKASDSADNMTAAITRVGPSAQTLVKRYDDTTASAIALQKAQTLLAQATDTLNIAVAEGSVTADQRSAVLGTLQTKVAALRDATAATLPVSAAMTQANGVAATAATGAAMAHAGFTRELLILGHEVVVGNYSRIPGSMMVLAERTGNLSSIISTLGGLVLGWPGLFAAGAAAIGLMVYSSNSAEEKLLAMQTALRATRDDYINMASEAQAAAKAVGAIPGFSGADTRTAAQTTAAAPDFTGTSTQLAALLRVEGDMATVMGQTLPEAAKVMAAAMMDPGKEADELAKTHFPGMTQALDDQIKAMQASGDTAGAFGQVLGVIKDQVSGAATASKTELQQALENLGRAFTNTGADGKSMGTSISDSIKDAVADTINGVAAIIGAVNSLRNAGGSLPGATNGSASSIVVPPAPAGALPSAVANQIYNIAEAQNFGGSADVSALQADFATRVAQQESHGQQFGPSGGVLTSGAGAMGVMGLMPGTAAGLGVDASDQAQNITGGLQYIAQLWTKYGGNPALVAMAYNWGPGNVDALLAGNKTLAQVPAETQAYVQSVAGTTVATAIGTGLGTYSGVPGLPLPPPLPDGAGTGVTNPTKLTTDQAIAAADKANTVAGSSQAAASQITLYTKALADLASQGDTSSLSVTKISDALQKAQLEFANAIPAVQKMTNATNLQAAGEQEIADAWANGAGAAQDATDHVKAEAQARTLALPTQAAYAAAVVTLTNAYQNLTAQQQGLAASQQINGQGQQLSYLQAETTTLGESADTRARELATMKEQQTIENSLSHATDAQKQSLLDNAAAIADATSNLQRQQAAWNEIGNLAASVADQIGSSISTAFINGNGAAVNFGNIARAALASVVTEALKLAIINPLMNAAFGTSSVTLGSVVSALGASGSGSVAGGSSSTGLLSLLGDGSTGISLLNALGLTGPGGLGATLGLTGSNGLLSSLGLSGIGGSITGFLDTPLIGTTQAGTAALDAAGINAGSVGAAAGTIGEFGSGIGLGYGAGSLVGGLIQSGLNKTGPAPDIGAGVGAAAGALAGTFVFPGVGTVLGGLLGGVIGGGGGGLIGPAPASAWSSTNVGLDTTDGLLLTGASHAQGGDASTQGSTESDAETINAALTALGIHIDSLAGVSQIGQNTPGGYQDPTKAGSLAAAFPGFQFGSASDPTLNKYLQNTSFPDLTTLETQVSGYLTLVNTTIPALTAQTTVTGTLTDAIAAINAQFGPAITAAQTYGVATDALTAAQTKATDAANTAAWAQVAATDVTLNTNYMNAAATISGNPADALSAQLYAFDASATQQTAALKTQLTGIYGDSFTTTQDYATQMAMLENSLGEQRLAIQQQYNDKLAASATSTVTSLTSYVQKLESSSASPLSPQAQYSLASQQFTTDATAAAGGDYNSLNNLTTYADTFLAASRTVNGSGAQYATDFQAVLNALTTAANTSPDVLTAGVLQSEIRTQTQQLDDALSDLGTKLDAIKAQLAQGAATPARIST